ncbi:MAG: hypothetical protein ACI9VS_002450, partial [Candidatus Binatia bacterium]
EKRGVAVNANKAGSHVLQTPAPGACSIKHSEELNFLSPTGC